MAALKALTADGLFIGQTQAFFALLTELAQAADHARTEDAGDKRRSQARECARRKWRAWYK